MISLQDVPGFFFSVAGDDEAVEPEGDLATRLTGVVAHLDELLGEPVEIFAVGEVPVGVAAAVAPRGRGVAALEDLGVGPLGRVERFGLEREVVNAIEVTAEINTVRRPNCAQHLKELGAAAVALVVFEPRLAEVGELVLEPARHHVDREPAVAQVVGGGAQLGQHGGLPQPRVDGGDHLELLRGQQQRKGEAGGLVLKLGAVAGLVADLAERVLESVVLRRLSELDVVLVVPVGALLDIAGDQAAADIGHPVGELDVVGDAFGRHGGHDSSRDRGPSPVTLAVKETQPPPVMWSSTGLSSAVGEKSMYSQSVSASGAWPAAQ